MRIILFITLYLSTMIVTEEVNKISGHAHRTLNNWTETSQAETQEGKTEVIELKPRVITKNVTAKPKILITRVTAKPKIFTETFTAPVKQIIYSQDTVLNQRVKAQPYYIRESGRTENRDAVTLPVKTTSRRTERTMNVPGNTNQYYTYIQPEVQENRDVVSIVNSPEIRRTLDPIVKPVTYKNHSRVRNVTIPGNTVYT